MSVVTVVRDRFRTEAPVSIGGGTFDESVLLRFAFVLAANPRGFAVRVRGEDVDTGARVDGDGPVGAVVGELAPGTSTFTVEPDGFVEATEYAVFAHFARTPEPRTDQVDPRTDVLDPVTVVPDAGPDTGRRH